MNEPVPGPSAPSYTPMTKPVSIAKTVCRRPLKRSAVDSPSDGLNRV